MVKMEMMVRVDKMVQLSREQTYEALMKWLSHNQTKDQDMIVSTTIVSIINSNKTRLKRFTIAMLLLMFVEGVNAFNFLIDGIWYDLDKDSHTASVTDISGYSSYATYKYKGRITIPSFVKYQGERFDVISIGDRAFNYCKDIESIKISEGVRSIGNAAFNYCVGLKSVHLPNTITEICDNAFMQCNSLVSIKLPANLRKIGYAAFGDCYYLQAFEVDRHNPFFQTIGGVLYSYNLDTLVVCPSGYQGTFVVPEHVKSIRYSAFLGCKSLTSVIIQEGVEQIWIGAFEFCDKLTNVTIPNSAEFIGSNPFDDCANLTSIDVKSDHPLYCSKNGILFNRSLDTLIAFPSGRGGTYYIPENVKVIGDQAFSGCRKLTSVNIPNSVISIERAAFAYCERLIGVEIPSSIVHVDKGAFKACKKLNYFKYPEDMDVTELGDFKSSILRPYKRPLYDKKNPPLLVLKENSLQFVDASKNNKIDADEQCCIEFEVINNGKGPAYNCETRVRIGGAKEGINVSSVKIPMIAVGQSYKVSVPISTNIQTHAGNVTFFIEVYEPNGWGVAPFDITIATNAFNPPHLQVVDYRISSKSGKIQKMEKFTLTFNLQNIKYGDAEDVCVNIDIPENVFVMDGTTELKYHDIKSGEVKAVQVVLAANNNYKSQDIPITIRVREKYNLFAEDKSLNIAINQIAPSSVSITGNREAEREHKEIKLALLKSDVDRNIPVSSVKNDNTFVLIIANENYSQVASVPFALNDGNIFREYCVKTLGIGEKHIKYLTDATGNQIKAGVNWLSNLTEAFENPQIIVYYAGHGIPDEANKSAYLLPVDGSGTDVTTGYKLDDLYATLGNMPASRIAVFMDACFSGSKREDGMLVSARGVALKAKSGVPQGNMVVFSAAQGDETAYPNREQQHGLFTYYLLKKLQETEGDVELKELGDYVTKQVTQQSLLLNSKKQTPTVIPSVAIGEEWKAWKLK